MYHTAYQAKYHTQQPFTAFMAYLSPPPLQTCAPYPPNNHQYQTPYHTRGQTMTQTDGQGHTKGLTQGQTLYI